jgi:hypothetical protein
MENTIGNIGEYAVGIVYYVLGFAGTELNTVTEQIIAAFHAGTLPESLLQSPENPTGLRLEEME